MNVSVFADILRWENNKRENCYNEKWEEFRTENKPNESYVTARENVHTI